jgi:hypothetical protein
MEDRASAEQDRFEKPSGEIPESLPFLGGKGPGHSSFASRARTRSSQKRAPSVFVFNPFTEAYIAHGKAFTPVKHQARLAEDLANLPQFLSQSGEVVLVKKRPSGGFLNYLEQAGFRRPEFVELSEGRLDPADRLCQREIGTLRPWAWGPDSLELFAPLFARVTGDIRRARQYYNDNLAQLYSKAWSAGFLRKVLARFGRERDPSVAGARAVGRPFGGSAVAWLCSQDEAGVAVGTLDDALGAIAAIRSRDHHRVVVKEAHGLAGHNAIRLWEPEILPAQRQWLARALRHGRQVVVEPWLERVMDFSIQLEMSSSGLGLCGYTGLINDRKGQFLANWAEPACTQNLPAKMAEMLPRHGDASRHLHCLYGAVFSLLEAELNRIGFAGPISIDAMVYRTLEGDLRLKPVVEINPRYTMGRLTLELMEHASPGSHGLFRLVTRAQARAEGFVDLSGYAESLGESLRLEGAPLLQIRQGTLCLNDPSQAQVCLATFEVGSKLNLPRSLCREEPGRAP